MIAFKKSTLTKGIYKSYGKNCNSLTLLLCSVQFLYLCYNVVTMYTGGMPPTPQAVHIAGQKQNQQQYDPSKGPPVQNAASLHTPPPQLPGRMPQGALPMAGLTMAISQQAQLVETAQPGGHVQPQVKVPAGGSVLATVNPHTQIQAHLQQQMQPPLHLQLQPQQQQSQTILQSGQAVRLNENSTFFKVSVPRIFNCVFRFLFFTDRGTWSPHCRVKSSSSKNCNQLNTYDNHPPWAYLCP